MWRWSQWQGLRWICLWLIMLLAPPLQAQQLPNDLSLGQVRSPVLTIDIERVFSESLFGQRVSAELLRQTEDLAMENRQIEAALTEEERSLTLRRPGMDAPTNGARRVEMSYIGG